MNTVDIVILIFIAFGFLLGFKRGFTRELVSLVGIFAIIILSFIFKNPISVFLYSNLPFLNFGGIFKDITVLNILAYEIIAFLIVFVFLTIIFIILLKITKIFEKILTATIILGIPSKIIGGVLGIIESYIYIFIVLYLLTLPVFNLSISNNSKISDFILTKTPIIHNVCDETFKIYNEIIDLKDEYKTTENVKTYNQKVLCIMINDKVITKENAQKLIDLKKIKDVNIDECSLSVK